MNELRTITRDGLWKNNPGLVQLLGLCPLLAVSVNAIGGLTLGLATIFVLAISNTLVSLVRRWLLPEIRVAVFVTVIASAVTALELLMHAYLHDLYRLLGLFIPLIVTNCIVIGRAEAFAARQPARAALADGLAMGTGFAAVLILLGALRELLGQGTVLAQADLLFGPAAANWTLHVTSDGTGLLLVILPPGAFFALAALVALHNRIETARARRVREAVAAPQHAA